MSETPKGRTLARDILQYDLKLAVLAVAAAAALFTYGRWPGAIGVLAGLVLVGTLSVRMRKSFIRSDATPLPNVVVLVGSLLNAVPGVILIFVGYLTGNHFIILLTTAVGTSLIGMSGLLIAMTRSVRTSRA
jgi:hypothetical protein